MALPQLRADGTLPPGQHLAANLDEVRAVFPPATARRQALDATLTHLVDVVRRLGLGVELVIDGSYTTGKADPSDIDLAMLSSGLTEAETLRRLEAEGVDLVVLDLFVVTSRLSLERWIQFFSIDRVQQTRGVIILRI